MTGVPPAGRPPAGLTPETAGTPAKLYWSAGLVALVPSGVVTVMSTVPAVSTGATAMILVAELTT